MTEEKYSEIRKLIEYGAAPDYAEKLKNPILVLQYLKNTLCALQLALEVIEILSQDHQNVII